MKFRVGTSNVEGVPKRHAGLVGEDAQEILARLCNLFAGGGCFPRLMEAVLARLLAKKDGGSRPIMLFRSMFRVHSKPSKKHGTVWELEEASGDIFNNSPGRGIGGSNYGAIAGHAIEARKTGQDKGICHALEIL